MSRLVTLFDQAVGKVSGAAGAVASVAVLLIAVGVTVNALARYLFNKPLLFVDEYAQYLLVVIFYLGVGYTLRAGKHVSVVMLVDRLGQRSRAILGSVMSVVSFLTLSVMCYYSWTSFFSTRQAGIVSLTPMQTPLDLPFLAVAVGMTIFALEMVVVFINNVRQLANHRPP